MNIESLENAKRRAAVMEEVIKNNFPDWLCVKMEVTDYGVSAHITKKGEERGFRFHETDGLYGFALMLGKIAPSLAAHGIPFDEETFSTVKDVWDMGGSEYCYNYGLNRSGEYVIADQKKRWKDYFAGFALPDEIKAEILDGVRASITSIKPYVHTDYEGCTYNSIVWAQPAVERTEAA